MRATMVRHRATFEPFASIAAERGCDFARDAGGGVWADPLPPGLFVAPATFSVSVEENLLPGGNVFKDGQVVDTGQPDAPPSVQRLHTTDHSSNFSGRSHADPARLRVGAGR